MGKSVYWRRITTATVSHILARDIQTSSVQGEKSTEIICALYILLYFFHKQFINIYDKYAEALDILDGLNHISIHIYYVKM
jgi:hypothetical protein